MNMKNFQSIMFLLTMNWFLSMAQPAEIWVSPDGSDRNPGTREKPMATLLMAQRKARELRRLNDSSAAEGIQIIMRGGKYRLTEPLFFRTEDSGTELSPTFIEAAPGEKPVISGGVNISGWQRLKTGVRGLPANSLKNVWVADAPRIGGHVLQFRQLWVNNKKAVRAGNQDDVPLNRILSVNSEKEEIWVPVPPVNFTRPDQLEFIIHQWWATANLRIKSIDIVDEKARLTFQQPESRIEFEHPWPAPFIDKNGNLNGNSAFYLTNAIELLDRPGEWFEDLDSGKVYYWPGKDEDMNTATVTVPFLETLVYIEGTLDHPVRYLNFEGIDFEYTTWLRPSLAGHVPLQAGMYILDAYKLKEPGTPDKASLENQAWTGRQPAGMMIACAGNINVVRCSFRHMAATAVDFVKGTSHDVVTGCIFNDIGGTAIQMGFFGGTDFEAHLPYNPSDEREICRYETISNNLITNCTGEDWGCVGISVGYAHDINIEHNEVSHLNYSGICIGWGWTKTITCMRNNRIHANHIHHFAKNMYDVGGIYTLSAQPNTEISSNYIHHLQTAPYAHIPEHYQYIYLDEGSSYIRVMDNRTEKEKFFSNSPGPGNEWKNNGPQVSEEIKDRAGLEPGYRDLLKEYEMKNQ